MKSVIYALNVSRRPIFSAATSLMTEILTVSRLNYRPDLIVQKSVCPLPDFSLNFNKSFEETSVERAEELWKNFSQDDTINVLWSGGIDSTVVLAALLMSRPSGFKITVFCNLNSISENTDFYRHLLTLNFVMLKSSSLISTNRPLKIITGELGDQIFGSDLLFRVARQYGFDNLFLPYTEIMPKLFESRCGAEFGQFFYERYRPIVNEAPFKIQTAFDFVWWWNFTQKWQCVKFRHEGLVSEVHKLIHFFDSESFQNWSVFNHDSKIGSKIETYKMPAKKLIFSYDKNEQYLINKKKFGSPFGNKRHFLAMFEDGSKVHDWTECNELIDKLSLIKIND